MFNSYVYIYTALCRWKRLPDDVRVFVDHNLLICIRTSILTVCSRTHTMRRTESMYFRQQTTRFIQIIITDHDWQTWFNWS